MTHKHGTPEEPWAYKPGKRPSVGHDKDCKAKRGECRCRECLCCSHRSQPDACHCPLDCRREVA